MQVIIKQAEIEQAIQDYMGKKLVLQAGHQIKIDLKSTRGEDGFSAIIDIEDAQNTAPTTAPASTTAPQTAAKAQEPAAKPVSTTQATQTPAPAEKPASEPQDPSPATSPVTTAPAAGSLFGGVKTNA